MSEQELNEFKASGEDSEVMEPTGVKAKKRKADKDDLKDSPEKIKSDGATKEGGDLIDTVATKKAPPRRADKTMGEHIDEIFDGEELSEDFKEKASVIFETVVNQHVNEKVAELEEQFDNKLDEQVERVTEELAAKLDTYLDYVVEQWMEANELAVERGIRTEITESFMSDLHELFVQHNVNVPDEATDLVAEMADKIADLEEKLNTETDTVFTLRKELEEAKKEDIIEEVSEGLAETQAEKLRGFVEDLEYVDLDDYRRKVITVKENYFNKSDKPLNEEKDELDPVDSEDEGNVYVDPRVAMYAQNITKTFKNIK